MVSRSVPQDCEECTKIIYSAVARNELLAYFRIKSYVELSPNRFQTKLLMIISIGEITTLSSSILGIQHTLLTFRGSSKPFSKLIHQFRMDFLRAGG